MHVLYKTPPSLGNNPFSLSTRLHLFLGVFPIICPGILFCSTLRPQERVIFVPVSSNSSHSGWVVMLMMAWVRLVPVSWNRCGCFSLRSLPACQFQVYNFLRLWGYTVLKILCDWSRWERNLIMRLSLRIPLTPDHHRGRHRNHRFRKDHGKSRAIPDDLFCHLDRCFRHSYRDNGLVMAADREEIVDTFEHIEVGYLAKFAGSSRSMH